jgi:type I restriction-modification system DNA methylase subunit
MSKPTNIKLHSNFHNMSITNKEALRDKIHEIHNYLRNNGAGYGMNALKVFNIIYGLKKIEEYNLYEKLGIKNDKCKFSYLLELANQNNKDNSDDRLMELVLGSKTEPGLLDYFYDHINLRKFLYYEIPRNISSKILSRLVLDIDNIEKIEKSCNVQLSGKIYEYFIGRDESAISELGAYFTDRHIVNYIYDKINIEINEDGSIPSMVDMFGGSGGFTTGYIHYLNQKYNSLETNYYKINWNTELSKVHHYDMNEDVIKSAGLEFLCLTSELPDMDNLQYKNSFNDEFENNKFSYIVTNPPYGGDKNKKKDANNKLEKIKSYILNRVK